MSFKINKVELKNFISYKDARVELPSGFVILHGENGAGKTSLIDAIAFAISSKAASRRSLKQSELVRKGSSSSSVKLYFEVGGRQYKVERSFGIGKLSEAYLYDLNNKKRIARGTSSVNKELAKLLGFENVNVAVEAMFVPQGRLTEIVELGPSELRDKMIEIIGLGKRDNITNKMNDLIKSFKMKAKVLESKVTMYKNQKEKLKKLMKKEKEIESELKELEGRLGEIEIKLRELAETYEILKEKHSTYVNLVSMLSEKEKEFEEVMNELKSIKYTDEDKTRLREELEEMKTKLSRKREMEFKLKYLEEMKKMMTKMSEVKKRLEKLDVSEEDKGRLEEELEAVLKEKEELSSSVAGLRTAINYLNEELRKLSKTLNEVTELTEGKSLEELLAEIAELEASLEDMIKKRDELSEIEAKIRSKIELIEDSLEALEKSEGKCPVCGAPLSEERKRELIEEKVKELKKLKEELEKVARERIELEKWIGKAEKELERLRSVYNKVDSLLSQYDLDEVEGLKLKVKQLKDELSGKEERLKAVKRKYAKVVEEEERMRKALRKLESALREKRALEAQLREIEETVEKMRASLNVNDVDAELDEVRKELNELEKLERLKGELEKKLEVVERSLLRKKELEATALKLEREINDIKGRIERLGFDEEKFERTKEEYEKLSEARDELLEEVNKLKGELSALRKEIEEREKELKEMEKDVKEYEELIKFIDFLEDFKKKIPQVYNVVSENFRALWEREANKLLESFDLSVSGIKIKKEKRGKGEGWSIEAIGDNGKELKVDSLSGGERVGVALALKLALVRLLSRGKVSVLILDEPTINLDEERKRRLKEILVKAVGPSLHQLIVVTHDQEVLDVAEHLCRVRKGPNGSEVLCDGE